VRSERVLVAGMDRVFSVRITVRAAPGSTASGVSLGLHDSAGASITRQPEFL
jgi:hypothetical protein